MKRLIFLIVISLVLISSMVLAGCAKPAPSPAQPPAPTPKPEKVWVLKSSQYGAATQITSNGPTKGAWDWAKAIEEATNGRVKTKFYWSQALGKAPDQYDMTVQGICDVTNWPMFFAPGRFPITGELSYLPFLGATGGEQGTRALQKVYESIPEVRDEFKDVHVACLYTDSSANLFFTKKAVHTMEDMKGLRIRSMGATTQNIKDLGAVPVVIPPPEAYGAVERGVVDGLQWAAEGMLGLRIGELLKHTTICSIYSAAFVTCINLNTWNSFPKDIQEAIDSVSGMERAAQWGETIDEMNQAADEAFKTMGIEYYFLAPQELQRWRAATQHQIDDWLAKRGGEGLPAQKAFDIFVEELEKWKYLPAGTIRP